MRNPYEVLGVRENAPEAEVKAAYRELVKKYHPDSYADNPLADLAAEKLKEINEAYDMIMKGQANSYQSQRSQSGGGYGNYNSNASFNSVRAMINSGNIIEAERILMSMNNRNAEWNYLMGVLSLRKGWYDNARSYLQTAVSMEPNNLEYRNAYNSVMNQGNMYRSMGGNANSDQLCDCCTQLYCADCCCECMGGDLVSCC